MSKPIIEIDNISKCYRIGANREPYLTLRDELVKKARGFYRRFIASHRHIPKTEEFWALRDVSFNVQEGEVVGIIGRNGAGKSTLLKILSQITPPTQGQIIMRGRVASLLEVGTGFHPELTGRENIFLNGTILGMTRNEVKRKFDEIVAFAEIDKFLDTPVKRYSSGMYVRLAFAVAAHLEPEILVVDEVLAVGDAQFQRKCMGKMSEVAKSGRTVLFVSHNMAVMLNICKTGVFLSSGKNMMKEDIETVVSKYLNSAAQTTLSSLESKERMGNMKIKFKSIKVTNDKGEQYIIPGKAVVFELRFYSKLEVSSERVNIAIGIDNMLGSRLLELHTKCDPNYQNDPFLFCGDVIIQCKLAALPLKPETYILTFWVDCDGVVCDALKDHMQMEVAPSDFYNTGFMPSRTQGWIVADQRWDKKQ